jgi:hypothetical protein
METQELIDESPALRWTLRVWNALCLTAAAGAFVLAILLLVAGGGDDYIGDAIAAELAGLMFVAILCLGGVWLAGRATLLLVWNVVRTRTNRHASAA